MSNRFDTYLKTLAAVYRDGGTEHTGRTPLENLLNAFAAETMDRGTEVQHEGGREGDKGAPDYKIKRRGMILGYVETKQIGDNLDKILKTDQIARYRKLSDNILVTDYLQFIRIDGAGKVIAREMLAYPNDLESRMLRINPERAEAVSKLLEGFFSSPPVGLSKSDSLAVALATRSRLLRDYLTEELIRQEKANKEGRLHALYDVFREQFFHDLSVKEFADAFAQMLAYGLFLAKLNAGDNDIIRLDNVRQFIPGSFRLIRELVRFIEEMQESEYDEARWVVEEILSIVNGLNIESIRDSLSFRQRKAISRKVRAGDEEEHRLFERDPFIYFYEDFLKAYDKETRKARGVYYTPPPVVNFIVRAVDDILKDTFKIADGLADHKKVTVLDFAAGTGTFLLEVMQRIFDNIGGPEAGKADSVVREHMLKNLYGFEYLIAPYTIAHLKLSQYLKDKGHSLKDDERLQVFLTNTLEPVAPQRNMLLPAISAEVEAAQAVKEQPILAIIGNPPYSGHSKNLGAAAQVLVERYRTVDGKPLGERKVWLQDDYVKFVAFAHQKMDSVDRGVIGLITNHNYLDGPTFRGMRQSLLKTFDLVYVFDLHGNSKRVEAVPSGVNDENVFDIQAGVSLLIAVKGVEKAFFHADLWESRKHKYQTLSRASLEDTNWTNILPESPNYFFVPKASRGAGDGYSLERMFVKSTTALQTSRDEFAIAFSAEELRARVAALSDPSVSDERFRSLLKKRVGSSSPAGDSSFWTLSEARAALRGRGLVAIEPITYRPFDNRFVIYDEAVIHRMKRDVSDEMLGENVSLLAPRQLSSQDYHHAFVASSVSEMCVISAATKEQNRVYPLWRRRKDESGMEENLSPDFRTFLDTRYDHHYSPEEILGYIYAVLHAPAYRTRYAEFLRIDFPRIPFAEAADDFEVLSRLGWALVQAHLMRDLPRRGLADYHGKGTNEVEHVRWSAEDSRIAINATQSFAPVPETVWNFHIGGYQVIDKYLKSRKGRTLSLDEINHVARIADALAFTIGQMERIDALYGEIFPQ